MAESDHIEKIFTIPLRKAKDSPKTKRAPRAIKEIRIYLAKHLDADIENIWLEKELNELIWARGITHSPSKIRVRAVKWEDGLVEVAVHEG